MRIYDIKIKYEISFQMYSECSVTCDLTSISEPESSIQNG